MTRTNPLLTLFLVSMQNQNTRDQAMAEVGSPKDVTRFAHKRNADGALIVITDTVNGPQFDDAMETISASILGSNAMLTTMQNATDNIGAISTDEHDTIAQGFATYLEQDKDVQLSAKGDSDLDGNTKVFYFTKPTNDANYTATDVSEKLQDYIVDGDMSFVYAQGKGILINTEVLARNLNEGNDIVNGAVKVIAIGRDKKLARGPNINVGGQKVPTWTYVGEGTDGSMEMVILAKDTLDELQIKPFDGKYATADRKGDEIIFVTRIQNDGANIEQGANEQFQLNRVSTDTFLAIETNPA